ncbi:MAG: EFR1 family ferrodoxin [Eubacteriales bacterium]|nr:EFR1 family ferrodoxin [Eubacteriales bacterium]MDD3199289.1 EFR1 family ferrodoxin [Eubacteriales bacterium]MDD4121288.1 EFR1 family ferrodoxin [Eubacteriales bacterium]MDD4629419.1 EFR1 family ferrodoxin [Eubacteriales bacterium]
MILKVWAVYFSATGTTKKVIECIAKAAAQKLNAEYDTYDFTLPDARKDPLKFLAGDMVIFGTPVYAGRVPNVLLKYLAAIEGNNAAAVPVVLYGNRDYDDALIELRDILEKGNLHTIAAAAFIGEHSFSYKLANARPDEKDMLKAADFAIKTADKVIALNDTGLEKPVFVKGIPNPYRGYYQPRDRAGNPVDIRKVKPLTNEDCNNCMICADVCPMGSISRDDVREYTGICIKCGACIKKCPLHAKYYEDAGFLYHKNELEEGLTRRAEPEWFL